MKHIHFHYSLGEQRLIGENKTPEAPQNVEAPKDARKETLEDSSSEKTGEQAEKRAEQAAKDMDETMKAQKERDAKVGGDAAQRAAEEARKSLPGAPKEAAQPAPEKNPKDAESPKQPEAQAEDPYETVGQQLDRQATKAMNIIKDAKTDAMQKFSAALQLLFVILEKFTAWKEGRHDDIVQKPKAKTGEQQSDAKTDGKKENTPSAVTSPEADIKKAIKEGKTPVVLEQEFTKKRDDRNREIDKKINQLQAENGVREQSLVSKRKNYADAKNEKQDVEQTLSALRTAEPNDENKKKIEDAEFRIGELNRMITRLEDQMKLEEASSAVVQKELELLKNRNEDPVIKKANDDLAALKKLQESAKTNADDMQVKMKLALETLAGQNGNPQDIKDVAAALTIEIDGNTLQPILVLKKEDQEKIKTLIDEKGDESQKKLWAELAKTTREPAV